MAEIWESTQVLKLLALIDAYLCFRLLKLEDKTKEFWLLMRLDFQFEHRAVMLLCVSLFFITFRQSACERK